MTTVETQVPIRSRFRARIALNRVALDNAWGALVLWWRDNAPGMAGMIAFFGFLSVIPLALLLLAVLGNLSAGVVSATDIRHLFHGAVPGLSESQFLHTYWDPVRHSKVSTTILGSVSLVFGSMGLHDSLDWAVNRIWKSTGSRPFWVAKVRGIAVIVWVTVFAVLSLGLTSIWALTMNAVHAPSALAATLTALVPSLVVDAAIFTALYKLTPTVYVHVRPAVIAGVTGASLWGISKVLFGWWVLQASTYNRVYGTLAAIVIVMLWLWISAMIFLYGAALCATIQLRASESAPPPDSWWYDS